MSLGSWITFGCICVVLLTGVFVEWLAGRR